MVPRRVAAAALALAACASPRQAPTPVPVAASAAPSAVQTASAAPASDVTSTLDESLAAAFDPGPGAAPAAGSREEVAATTAGLLADVALALTVEDTATARRLVAEAARLAPADPAVRSEAVRLLGPRWGQRGPWGWSRWTAGSAIPAVTPVVVAVDAHVPAGGRGLAPERWAATGRVNVEGMPIGVMGGAAGGEGERTLLARAPR